MATSIKDLLAKKAAVPAIEPLAPEPLSSHLNVPTKFRANGLHQFFKADGERVSPDADGYYKPKDAEEWDLLVYYTESAGLVVPE